MSKPDAKGSQSLEEILASIRVSLSEGSTGDAKSAPALVPEAETRAKLAPAADVPDTAGLGDGLSSRLAGALNGSSSSLDDDLAEFFAHVPTRAGGASKPAGSNGAAKSEQSPSFLSRTTPPADAKPTPTLETPGGGKPAGDAPAASAEFRLSRPETLRPSLPPLFGADLEPLPRTPVPSKANGLDSASLDARSGKVEAASSPVPEKIEPKLPDPAPEAEKVATPTPPDELPTVARVLSSEEQRSAAATPTPVPDAVAVAAEPAKAGPQGRALEEMIAQLLEPVLVRWLDTNLPRMIQSIVREEVERVSEARRPPDA